MSMYSLNCTVCKKQFSGGQDWQKHLTGGRHLDLARREWSTENNVRECCLVVFTTYSLTSKGVEKVIEHFSNLTTFVTDFVWWEDRSRIAVVQFESRAKVEDILNELDASSELQIDNERVQVKGAFDLLELEWRNIMPGDNERPSPCSSSVAQSTLEVKKRKRDSDTSSQILKKTVSGDEIPDTCPLSEQMKLLSVPDNHFASIVNETVDKLPATIEKCSPNSLRQQFWLIRQSTVIPDSEYNEALEIVDKIRKLFQVRSFTFRVTMFRNWFLKLRHPTKATEEDELIIYAYSTKSCTEFHHSHSFILDHFVSRTFAEAPVQEFAITGNAVEEWKLKSKHSAIPIRMLTYSGHMIELQVCRLLKYLCFFDHRCHPLLTLAHYWVYVNNVSFYMKGMPMKAHYKLQEPLNLQWLVIHFMCYRKYIPTVRDILQRPHQVLRYFFDGTDIGFFADLGYVREWKAMKKGSDWGQDEDYSSEDFVLGVVQLFLEFLEFCGCTLNSGNFILNTKDGEIIAIKDLLTAEPGKGFNTKLTVEEFAELKSLDKYSDPTLKKATHPVVDFKIWKLYMTHPFMIYSRFVVPGDIRQILNNMRETASKLKRFLEVRKCDGDDRAMQVCGNLQNILTVGKT